MLQVSSGALVALVFVLVVCFILPIAIYYVLYRFSDSKFKTFGKGALAYFVVRFVIEMPVNVIISHYTDMSKNTPVYALYLFIICPMIFVGINFAAIKFFGSEILSTGNSLMYSLGYVAVQNAVEVGFVGAMYLITLMGIRSSAAEYIVVSDADYVSASNLLSGSNLVTESIYAEMQELCSMPASYFIAMCLERLWVIAAYSAMLLIIWLAVKKRGALALLGAALGMRMLASLPTLLTDLGVISNKWISVAIIISILIVICACAVICWRKFIDRDEQIYNDSKEKPGC